MSLNKLKSLIYGEVDTTQVTLWAQLMEQALTPKTLCTTSMAIRENKDIDPDLLCLYVSGHGKNTSKGLKMLRDGLDVRFFFPCINITYSNRSQGYERQYILDQTQSFMSILKPACLPKGGGSPSPHICGQCLC